MWNTKRPILLLGLQPPIFRVYQSMPRYRWARSKIQKYDEKSLSNFWIICVSDAELPSLTEREELNRLRELDGYTVHLALSIFCSLKLASSALLYVLLQLTQNLASLYKDRNVLVDWQRGQFVNLGFNSDFFCNLSHVSNIVNPLMIFIFIFPYRYNL